MSSSYVNPWVKYTLFCFNFLGWVLAVILVCIAVYAQVEKQNEPTMASLTVDPVILLMVVGVLMFLITFCGCIGSLRENICLLKTFCGCMIVIFILQVAAGIWAFVFPDKARHKVHAFMNRTIIHYREDLDLQNILDYSQKKFGCCGAVSYNDWSMNKYFNCSDNPSQERCGVPYSCCLISKDEGVVNTMCGYGMQELDEKVAEQHIHTTGCLDKFMDWMRNNQFLLGAIALGFAVSQLIGIYLSCTLVNQIKLQSNCGAGVYY